MKLIREQLNGAGFYAAKIFFGIAAVVLGVLAMGFVAMAVWEVLQIVFYTLWMSIKAILLFLGASVCAAVGYGAYSLASRQRVVERPRSQVLPPLDKEQNNSMLYDVVDAAPMSHLRIIK